MPAENVSRTVTKSQLKVLLEPFLGRDLIVEECQIKSNTNPGENYGSVMLALDVTFRRSKNTTTEVLHVVAKLAPPTDFLLTVFDFKNTFCKEMSIYKLVNPEMNKIQRENGILEEDLLNVLPKFYGAQTSSGGDEDLTADTNAVLLLENLKVQGYTMGDRLTGLNLKHCELVLSKLAQFHALPIALRQKKPDVYQKTALKAAGNFNLGGGIGNPGEDVEKHINALKQNIPETIPYLERVRNHSLENLKQGCKSLRKEPFATIIHNDLWTNNMMFLYNDPENNSVPTDIKFVDFQTTLLCSPVRDLIFFLFTSTSDEVFRGYYEHLLNVYYSNFIKTLRNLKCDVSAFSFGKFLHEIDEFAPMEFYHILFMLNVIFVEKKDVKNLSDVDADSVKLASGGACKQKLLNAILEFDKRGWLCKST